MRLVITGNSGSLGEALGARAGEGVLRIVPNGVAGDDESRSTIRLYDPEREIEGVLRDLSPEAVVHFPWAPPGEGQRGALHVRLAARYAAELGQFPSLA